MNDGMVLPADHPDGRILRAVQRHRSALEEYSVLEERCFEETGTRIDDKDGASSFKEKGEALLRESDEHLDYVLHSQASSPVGVAVKLRFIRELLDDSIFEDGIAEKLFDATLADASVIAGGVDRNIFQQVGAQPAAVPTGDEFILKNLMRLAKIIDADTRGDGKLDPEGRSIEGKIRDMPASSLLGVAYKLRWLAYCLDGYRGGLGAKSDKGGGQNFFAYRHDFQSIVEEISRMVGGRDLAPVEYIRDLFAIPEPDDV